MQNTLDKEQLYREIDDFYCRYWDETFGTKLRTEVHACITLDFLYKQILEKAIESFDGKTDIFHKEAARKRKDWDK